MVNVTLFMWIFGALFVLALIFFIIIAIGNWKNGKEKKIYSGMQVYDITKKEVKKDENNNQ